MLARADSRQALALRPLALVQETQHLVRYRQGVRRVASRTGEQALRRETGELRQASFPSAWLSPRPRREKLAPPERREQLHEEQPEEPEQPERLLAERPEELAPLEVPPGQQQLQPSPPERSSSASSP